MRSLILVAILGFIAGFLQGYIFALLLVDRNGIGG